MCGVCVWWGSTDVLGIAPPVASRLDQATYEVEEDNTTLCARSSEQALAGHFVILVLCRPAPVTLPPLPVARMSAGGRGRGASLQH